MYAVAGMNMPRKDPMLKAGLILPGELRPTAVPKRMQDTRAGLDVDPSDGKLKLRTITRSLEQTRRLWYVAELPIAPISD